MESGNMTPEPNAQEPTPCEVPIAELLDRIPTDHRLVIEEPMSSTHIPVGVHCRKASATIRRLESENAALRKAAQLHDEWRKGVLENAQSYHDEQKALRAEVGRLREALEKLRYQLSPNCSLPWTVPLAVVEAALTAAPSAQPTTHSP